MAQITDELELTVDWQLVVEAYGFIGQKDAASAIEVCNADSLPSGDVDCHKVSVGENLHFPAPAAGNWYARIGSTGTAYLTFTAV